MNHPCKVLVVDDDPLNLQLVRRILSRAGFAVAAACSGEKALADLRAHNFAVVVSDIIMPGLSGLDLLRYIRISHPWLPVILMSSLDGESIRHAAVVGGAFALFEKPLDRAALVAVVQAANLSPGAHPAFAHEI